MKYSPQSTSFTNKGLSSIIGQYLYKEHSNDKEDYSFSFNVFPIKP